VSAGTSLVEGTHAAFHEVASCAKKVTDLVGDIAAASSQQTHGIAEVSTALIRVSEVTQTNSMNARKIEELTGNLSAQVTVMDDAVLGIRGMVTGAHHHR
jgi:methyl-accepting chemotaxis protein